MALILSDSPALDGALAKAIHDIFEARHTRGSTFVATSSGKLARSVRGSRQQSSNSTDNR
jgi:hypothetical protein